MTIRISKGYLLALAALMLVTGEIHEQVHINVGYFLCGGYGERDFNAWALAKDCALPEWKFLATAVGPVFSYLMMWTGAFLLLRSSSKDRRAPGFSLIFAPLPFARIFTAVMGGGDEKVVFLKIFENRLSVQSGKIAAAFFVAAVCLPPVLIAWSKLKNRFAWLYIAGFCVLPMVVLGFYVLTFLNSLLAAGFLSSAAILGTPTLVLVHFLLAAAVLFFARHRLSEIEGRNFG